MLFIAMRLCKLHNSMQLFIAKGCFFDMDKRCISILNGHNRLTCLYNAICAAATAVRHTSCAMSATACEFSKVCLARLSATNDL